MPSDQATRNRELVEEFRRRQVAMYAGGDIGPVAELLAEDIVWHVPGRSPIAGDHRGLSAVLGYFTRRRELSGNTLRIEVLDAMADDEAVAEFADGRAELGGALAQWRTVGLYRVAHERIAEAWLVPFDLDAFDRAWSRGEGAGVALPFGADAPLAEIMRTTRAMRRLKPDPVPRELLEQLVEAATFGPVGGNAQTFSWVVVTDRAQIARLAELWPRVYRLAREVGAATVPPGGDAAQQERIYRAADHLAEHFAAVPAVVVPCYDTSWRVRALARRPMPLLRTLAATPPGDLARIARHMPRAAAMTEAGSVYPGVQNLLLTARALGLGATLTTMHLFLEAEFKRVLGVPGSVKTFALIPVGWPTGRFGPVSRRPASEVIHWDRWR